MNKIDLKHPAGYDQDFARWSAEQAGLLRAGRLDRVDLENVAEAIESLGKSDKREIVSRLTVVLVHLLKWEFRPEARTNSWRASIIQNRDAIANLIEDSPTLQGFPATVVERAYRTAPLTASAETGLLLSAFPANSPYTIEQILDSDFWPGE